MKKLLIYSFLSMMAVSTFSCGKKCHGGGWYGNRNLGYTPTQKQTDKACKEAFIYTKEEDCEVTAP